MTIVRALKKKKCFGAKDTLEFEDCITGEFIACAVKGAQCLEARLC